MTAPGTTLPDPLVDEAIDWLIRLEINDSTPQVRSDFDQWLQQSPQHQLAWSRVQEIHSSFANLPANPIARTLTNLDEQSSQRGLNRRQAIKLLSLSGLLLGSGWLGREYTPWQRLLADFSTRIGEQKTVTLADGTTLTLNTDSAVQVDFRGPTRLLRLTRGEIQVQANQAVQHPLQLRLPEGQLETRDAAFVARQEAAFSRVSVQQGRLELRNRRGLSQQATAGSSFQLSAKTIRPAPRSAIAADAWLQGAISGRNIPLGQLLDELSRYRIGIISYAPELRQLPVSGTFQLRDTDNTLKFLARVQPVQVRFRTPYWVVVSPA